jgi:tRNA (guanine37-N1)-methyltransferase
MRFDIVTIFPDYFAPLRLSLVGKAIGSGLVEAAVHDLRDWTHDVHRTVDDTPFGGGAGMVMKPEPWGECLDTLIPDPAPSGEGTLVVIPSPSGEPFTQDLALAWSELGRLVIACGRYEGIDARVAQYAATLAPVKEVSLGDYVVNGGEVAALAIVEAVVRLLPGVVGNPESLREESHSPDFGHLLEYPLYTKPASWRGLDVPEVLLSGHHARIAAWRREKALELTRLRRPGVQA